MAKITILLADNDSEFAAISARLLEIEGYKVILAHDPTEAEELITKGGIDLAILDMRLTDDDNARDNSGLQVAKNVGHSIPKIIFTAFPDYDSAREALGKPNGYPIAIDFLSKAKGPDVLILAIEKLVENYLQKREIQNAQTSQSKKIIKVLFIAANPKDTSRLRLDEEVRSIDQALMQAEFRDRFDIKQHWAVRVFDIQGYLLRHKPDIVHFSGHGSSSSEIVFEDNGGNGHPVSPNALSQLFCVLKDNIRCVVLNACYSEYQAQAIAEHIDCVVGMSRSVSDLSAIAFAASFYQALGYGRSVKTAYDLGCIQINLDGLDEHNVPKLLASRINPEDISFVSE